MLASLGLRGARGVLVLAHQPSLPIHLIRPIATAPPSPPSYRLQGLLALSLATASIGLLIWERRTYENPSAPTSSTDTFNFKLRGPSGVQEYSFPRKTEAETEAKLRANETSRTIGRKGNPVVKWDRNWVGSNEPPEDRSAIDIIPRSSKGASDAEGSRDIVMFSVLDGHAGDATSKLLAKALHPTLALALASLQAGHVPSAPGSGFAALTRYLNPLAWIAKAWTPDNIMLSVQNT